MHQAYCFAMESSCQMGAVLDKLNDSFLTSVIIYHNSQPNHMLTEGWEQFFHSTKKPVTTMLTYPWKCTVLHCNHLGNTWKPLVLMTQHFDYCPSASEGDNQNVMSSAPVVSRCFPGGYNVKLYISRGRLAWWLLAFLRCVLCNKCGRFYFVMHSVFIFLSEQRTCKDTLL